MNLQDLFMWFLILFDLFRDYGDQTNVEWNHTILKGFQCANLYGSSRKLKWLRVMYFYFLIKKKEKV